MLFFTAKLDLKKVCIVIAAVVILVFAGIRLFSGKDSDFKSTAGNTITTNDDRVEFLKAYGWDVTVSPKESGQVRIPDTSSEVYEKYNTLQKSQGYDLSEYSGKTVMRYVYQVNNYPGTTDPVYATLLIYKNNVIGGDITDTSAGGAIHPLQKPDA